MKAFDLSDSPRDRGKQSDRHTEPKRGLLWSVNGNDRNRDGLVKVVTKSAWQCAGVRSGAKNPVPNSLVVFGPPHTAGDTKQRRRANTNKAHNKRFVGCRLFSDTSCLTKAVPLT